MSYYVNTSSYRGWTDFLTPDGEVRAERKFLGPWTDPSVTFFRKYHGAWVRLGEIRVPELDTPPKQLHEVLLPAEADWMKESKTG